MGRAALSQHALQLETADIRQLEIEDEAGGTLRIVCFQEGAGRQE